MNTSKRLRLVPANIPALRFAPEDPEVAETVVGLLLDQSRQNGRDIQEIKTNDATTKARLDVQDEMLRAILTQQRQDAPVIRTARIWQRALTYLAATTLVAVLGALTTWASGWLRAPH